MLPVLAVFIFLLVALNLFGILTAICCASSKPAIPEKSLIVLVFWHHITSQKLNVISYKAGMLKCIFNSTFIVTLGSSNVNQKTDNQALSISIIPAKHTPHHTQLPSTPTPHTYSHHITPKPTTHHLTLHHNRASGLTFPSGGLISLISLILFLVSAPFYGEICMDLDKETDSFYIKVSLFARFNTIHISTTCETFVYHSTSSLSSSSSSPPSSSSLSSSSATSNLSSIAWI